MKKGSGFLNLSIVVLIILVGVFSYNLYVFKGLESDFDALSKKKNALAEEQLKAENQQLLSAVKSVESKNLLLQDTVKWSVVLDEIKKTIPRENSKFIAEITSYSGTNLNDLNIGVKTLASDNPYLNVASTIAAFDDSDNLIRFLFLVLSSLNQI